MDELFGWTEKSAGGKVMMNSMCSFRKCPEVIWGCQLVVCLLCMFSLSFVVYLKNQRSEFQFNMETLDKEPLPIPFSLPIQIYLLKYVLIKIIN